MSVTPNRADADADLADLAFVNANSANDVGYLATCGRYWPTDNVFETKTEGSVYTTKWRFRFIGNEVNALKCIKTTSFPAANFVEADFRLLGMRGVDGWENYSLTSNLPGATRDVAFGDSGGSATPGASAVDIDALSTDVWYETRVSWDINGGMAPIAGQVPRVSFELVPSHWATITDPHESVCLPFYAATQNKAWCVFGNTRAYVSHGYRNNVSVPFSGSQSFTYPVSAPPPPATTGPNLFFIKTRNTDPAHGRVEVHTAIPQFGYGDGAHAVTRFGTNEQNSGWFQMVGNDLWYIKTKNTGSGRVELHSATAASGYRSGESFATRFGTNEQDNGWFQMVGTELFYIKTKNTGSGRVEVFSATRASGYQSGQANASWIPASDNSNGWFQMLENLHAH